MSFGRAWSPTHRQRKSPLSERQKLQRNPEERLSPLSTWSTSHFCRAANPASAGAAALRPSEPFHSGLRVPGRATCPESSYGGGPSHTLLERSPLPAAPADPHGEWLSGPRALGRGLRSLGDKRGNFGSRGGWERRVKWVLMRLALAKKRSRSGWGEKTEDGDLGATIPKRRVSPVDIISAGR